MAAKIFKSLLFTTAVLATNITPLLAFAAEGDWILRTRGIGILADGDGLVENTALETDVDNAITPELDLTYFFTDHIAAELIAATAEHTAMAGTSTLGDTWVLPPTLTVQYHFTPDKAFSPYIGAGLNYTIFYAEDARGSFSDFKVDNSFGWAAQAGFDYWINDRWGLNLDLKYIDINADVSVVSGGSTLRANDVDIDPVIVGAGVSYRF